MSLDRPNLADAFNKPRVDRSAGVTGLLPTPGPQRTAPSAAPTEPFDDTAPVGDAPTAVPANRLVAVGPRQRQAAGKQRVSEQANLVNNVAVHLEPDLLDSPVSSAGSLKSATTSSSATRLRRSATKTSFGSSD